MVVGNGEAKRNGWAMGRREGGICSVFVFKFNQGVTAGLILIQFQRCGFQPFPPVSTRQIIP